MWGAIKKAINSNLSKSLDVLIQEKATETNGKVDSKASQTSVDTVKNLVQDGNNLVGSNNNTGGSIGVGSISARINKLLTDWTTTRASYLDTINTNVGTLINGRVVKSVQRGTVEPAGQGDVTIQFNNIQPAKSMVLLDYWYNHDSNRGPYILSLNSTNMIIRHPGHPSFTCSFSWQVIEFY